MKSKNKDWIQEATAKMEKKGTVGLFTKKAEKRGLTAEQFAKKVLKNPNYYDLKTRKEAQFAANVAEEYGWGGFILGSAIGGYAGYKVGKGQEKSKDVFKVEKKIIGKIDKEANEARDRRAKRKKEKLELAERAASAYVTKGGSELAKSGSKKMAKGGKTNADLLNDPNEAPRQRQKNKLENLKMQMQNAIDRGDTELVPKFKKDIEKQERMMGFAKGGSMAGGGKITDSVVWGNGEIVDDWASDVGGSNQSRDNVIEYEGKRYLVTTNFDQDMLLTPSKKANEWDDESYAKGGGVWSTYEVIYKKPNGEEVSWGGEFRSKSEALVGARSMEGRNNQLKGAKFDRVEEVEITDEEWKEREFYKMPYAKGGGVWSTYEVIYKKPNGEEVSWGGEFRSKSEALVGARSMEGRNNQLKGAKFDRVEEVEITDEEWKEREFYKMPYAKGGSMAKGGLITNQSEKHLMQVLIGLGMKSKSIFDKNKPYFDEEDRELLRKMYDRLDEEQFAKGGSMASGESVKEHLDKADSHLREVGTKLYENKNIREKTFRKEKGKFDDAMNDLLPNRYVSELGYAKGGSMASGGEEQEVVLKRRRARLTPKEYERLEELQLKVKINEQTTSEDEEFDKLVHKYRDWDYAKGGKTQGNKEYIKNLKNTIEAFEEAEKRSILQYEKEFNRKEVKKHKILLEKATKKMAKGGMTQGYNARLDESLGNRKGKKSTKKQSYKDRRDESKGMEKASGKRAYSSVGTMDNNGWGINLKW